MTQSVSAPTVRYKAASPLNSPRNWAVTYLIPVNLNPKLSRVTHITLEKVQQEILLEHPDLFEAAIAPAKSFLDDITLRRIGRGGRPLIASLSPDGPQSVEIGDFTTLNYSAEGRHVSVALTTPERLEFKLADAIILFANGDAFHALSFTPANRIDDASCLYCMLALQQLVMPGREKALHLRVDGTDLDLQAFSQHRLRCLAEDKKQPGLLTSGSMADFVDATALYTEQPAFSTFAVDDEDWAQTISQTSSLNLADALVHEPVENGSHLPEQNGQEFNKALALAGFVQGVCDIPFQSGNELSDALAPLYEKAGLSVFHSRHMLVEIAADWRTLRELQDNIGACPYALCTAAVSHFNARLVQRAEKTISELISDQDLAFAEPLPQLRSMLRDNMRQLVAGPSSSLRALIEQRLALFEHVFAQRITDLFRYEEERLVMSRIEERLGVKARFEHTLLMVNEFNSLLDEVIELGASASGRRIGFLLLLLSLLSLVSVVADSVDLLELNFSIPVKATLLGVSIVGLLGLTTIFALRDYSAWRVEKKRHDARRILKNINRRSPSKRSISE